MLYNRTLILEVDYDIVSDPDLEVDSIEVSRVDGEPLPEWMFEDQRQGVLMGDPPVGVETIELRMEVTLSDGTVIVRYCQVDVTSGEISELGGSASAQETLPSFINQLAMGRGSFESSPQALVKALGGTN